MGWAAQYDFLSKGGVGKYCQEGDLPANPKLTKSLVKLISAP